MVKIIATALTIAVLSVMGGHSVAASPVNPGVFDLVEYIENHEIQSIEDFKEVIVTNTDYTAPDYNSEEISYFDISIDYDSYLVCVTTLGYPSISRGTEVSNSASKEYYSSSGAKIFTITVSGRFSYTSNSCNNISKSGGFSHPFYSFWTSTPSVTSGHINSTKAYARTSGTATSGGNSISYSLTLTCDNTGHFTSY